MKIKPKQLSFCRAGFTLAELLVALSVMSVILAAAATLAFAMGSAESATNKMGEKQARLRFTTMRVRELARNSSLVFTVADGVVFWKDDANADGQINANEIALLLTKSNGDGGVIIKIVEFPNETAAVSKSQLQDNASLKALINSTDEQEMVLFDDCVLASISLGGSDKVATVDFSLIENGETKDYQISGMVRASADYLFTPAGSLVSGDDDL